MDSIKQTDFHRSVQHISKRTANVAHDTNKVDRDVNAQMFISKRAHSVIAYKFKGIDRTNEERSCPMLAERYICELVSVLAGEGVSEMTKAERKVMR